MAEPRRPGRPPLDPNDRATARVHVSLSPRDYDRADKRAKRDGMSIPELARRGLARVLSDPDDE